MIEVGYLLSETLYDRPPNCHLASTLALLKLDDIHRLVTCFQPFVRTIMKTIDEMKLEKDVPVVFTDQQGFVTYVNDCFTTVFGWSVDDITGQIITVIIPEGFHAPHHLGFSRFLTTKKSTILDHPMRLKAITKDGRELEAEHLIMAAQRQEQWVFMATLRPLN